LAEAIGTFLLMLIMMGVAVDERAPPGWAGLIIGLTVGGIITITEMIWQLWDGRTKTSIINSFYSSNANADGKPGCIPTDLPKDVST
jgi:hypothetical protein